MAMYLLNYNDEELTEIIKSAISSENNNEIKSRVKF